MNKNRIRAWLVTLLFSCIVQIASAHHSVGGQFDVTKTIILNGTVKRVDWVNPHIYIHLDVLENGRTATWRLGTVPVAMARKAGITKESLLAPGQTLKMSCYPARDGTAHLGFVFRIEYPDGHFVATNPDRV
jgi:hypothetical protein